MSAGSIERLTDAGGAHTALTTKTRYRSLDALRAAGSSPVMSSVGRLVAAGYLVALLVISLIGQILSLSDLRAVGVSLFLLTGWGIAPCLLVGTMSISSFVLYSGAISVSATTLGGYLMARFGMWHPTIALLFAAGIALVILVFALPADINAVRLRAPGHRRVELRWSGLSLVGGVLIAADAAAHRGAPAIDGLLARVDPIWYVGVLIVLAAVILAWVNGSSPAVPLLVLAVAVVASQAIAYGAPAVMSAAKHVGVLEYINSNGLGVHSQDIYQAWPGLFAAGAWVTGAAGIGDPMTLATWFPVVLSLCTALAIRHLAGRFLRSAGQAWTAAAIATLGGSVNIIYFAPQSVGFALCLIISALLIGSRPDQTIAQMWLRYGFVAVLVCAVTITHQISPYLMVAQFVVLVLFRLVRPWWIPIALLVPPIAWALLHKSSLGGFISVDAIGRFFTNLAPPVHGGANLPTPWVARLVFDIPAAVLVVIGVLAVVAVVRQRDRVRVGLLVTAASSASLFAVTNYGSEGVFRVVLFALPWLAILAVMAFDGVALDRTAVRVTAGVALAALFMVNAFGQTGLDWARVVRPDTTAAIRQFETTAANGAVLLVVGTGNAIPGRVTARYNDVQYASRETLNNYPVVTSAYDPAADLAQLTAAVEKAALNPNPSKQYYALVSDSTGAWQDRYGMQTFADYQRLEQAVASSRSWTLVFSGPTTKLYKMTAVGS